MSSSSFSTTNQVQTTTISSDDTTTSITSLTPINASKPTYSTTLTHGLFCSCTNDRPCSYALDGEMVRVTIDGSEVSRLARFSVVDCHGRTILNEFVQVSEPVTNYGTQISGIEPHHILASNGAITLDQLHSEIHRLLLFDGKSKIVGHGLEHDFECLRLRPLNSACIRDSSTCRLLCNPRKPRKLRDLVKERLNLDIQMPGQSHDSIEDAVAAMRLYLSIRERWEKDIEALAFSNEDDPDVDMIKHKSHQRLRHIVLQYSITDIFAPPNLDNLPHVPQQFDSTDHYAATFRPLLVEENRTACKRQLELLSEEQPQQIEPGGTSISSIFEVTFTQTKQDPRDSQETRFIMTVEEPSQHRLAKTTLLPSSVLLIVELGTSQQLSEHIREFIQANLKSSGLVKTFPPHIFGLIQRMIIPKDPKDKTLSYYLNVSELFSQEFLTQHPIESTKFGVVCVNSLISDQRADDALDLLVEGLNQPIFWSRMLSGQHAVVAQAGDGQLNHPQEEYLYANQLRRFCESLQFNSSQIAAVLAAAHLEKTNGVLLIKGPPGTGKTNMTVGLLSYLTSTESPHSPSDGASQYQRVLCCAPTNVAGREIAQRFCHKFLTYRPNHVQGASSSSPTSSSSSSTSTTVAHASTSHPQFASFFHPKPFLGVDENNVSLDLSQVLLIGTERDIIPYGLDKEDAILKEAALAEQVEEGEEDDQPGLILDDEEHRRIGVDGFMEAEDPKNDIFDFVDQSIHQSHSTLNTNYTLSLIYQDHRKRRLRLLFIYIQRRLVQGRQAGMFETRFINTIRQRDHARVVDGYISQLGEWKSIWTRIQTHLNDSSDLPYFGPTELRTIQPGITPDSGRKASRQLLKTILSCIEEMLTQLLEGKKIVSAADLQQPSLELEWSPDSRLTELRREFVTHLTSFESLVSSWLLCLSDFAWSDTLLVLNARLVFSTVSCAARRCIESSEDLLTTMHSQRKKKARRPIVISDELYTIRPISCVVMDEAAQLCESYLPIVLHSTIERLILVGDPQQLPAVVTSIPLQQRRYERSLYQRLSDQGWPVQLLNVQYRMHPNISCFPNQQFYAGRIMDAPTLSHRLPIWSSSCTSINDIPITTQKSHPLFDQPLVLLDLPSRQIDGLGESKDLLNSFYNKLEEESTITLLHALDKRIRFCFKKDLDYSSMQPITVGIIAPYRRQIIHFQQAISTHFPYASTDPILRIRAATVDAFQGQECDILIFSATRSNPEGDIGFVSNPNRFNVAITRAKHLLIVLGDHGTLGKKSALWYDYIRLSKKAHQHEEKHESDDTNRDQALSQMPTSPQVINAGQVSELTKLIDPKKQCLKAFLSLSSRPGTNALSPGYGDILYEIQLCGGDQLNKLHKMSIQDKKVIFNGWYQLLTGRFLTPNLINYHKKRLLTGITGIPVEWTKNLYGLIHVLKVDRFYFVWSIDLQQADDYVHQRIVVWLITGDLNAVHQAVSHRALAMQQLSDEYLDRLRVDLNRPVAIVPRKAWSLNEIQQLSKMRMKPSQADASDHGPSIVSSSTSTSSFHSSMASSSSSTSVPVSTGDDPFSHAKFFTLNSQLVSVILDEDDHELDPDFDLGADETQIMNHNGALIILGRSGTGKTTIQLKRLLRNEIKSRILQQQRLKAADDAQPNQLSTTSSATVVPRVQLENDTDVNPDGSVHQLLLTQSEQLCRHLVQDYHRKIRTTILRHPLRHAESKDEDEGMCEEEKNDSPISYGEDSDHLARIPNDFRLLTTAHFPLFLTTKKLLLMLDGTCPSPYFLTDDSLLASSTVVHRSSHLRDIDDMLDYHFFSLDSKSGGAYWPTMNEKLRKGLTPAQVWTEIFSIIKGQIGLVSDGRVLTEIEYQDSKVSQIPSDQRSQVYQLFVQYQVIKKSRGEFDLTDALAHITKQLSRLPTLGIPIHFVYCDEVQDLLPSQIALMKYFRTHPHGFVLAGDTAQSISVGVQFRFSTLKDIFFKYLANEDSSLVPELSKLYQNYRSHGGVLNLANSIVSLLISFFPLTMDKLPLETANADGAKPKLIRGGTDADVERLFGNFGADQVILVRDADAKTSLKKLILNSLILTISEAKGLEFKEVLIYNFFTDAPTTTQTGLRLIYKHMKDLNLPIPQAPPLQDQRHLVLNTKLKNFYVALTRAKWTVWIYETKPTFIQPLVDLWSYGTGVLSGEVISSPTSLIDIVTDLTTLTIARESTPAEYRDQGHKLFDGQRYEDSARFYDLAKEPHLVAKARAYLAYTEGQECITTIQSTSKRRMDKISLALSIKSNNPTNPLNKRASDAFKLAAIIFTSLHPSPLHDMAGKAYEQCGEFELAAQQYVLVKQFKRAIQLLLILKPPMYQQALQYAEQGQWYQKCFELALDHELFILDKDVDRCLRWLSESRDPQLCTGFVLGVVHSLLSRRSKERNGSSEFIRYGKLITSFMSKCSKSEIELQVTRLELDGQDAIAAQILQEVDPIKGARAYTKAGRYFHAAELLTQLQLSNPTNGSISTDLNIQVNAQPNELIELLLVPLRYFISIPALSNESSTLVQLPTNQRQSLSQILNQLKSMILRPSLHAVEIDLLDHFLSQVNQSASSSISIQTSPDNITITLTSLLNSIHACTDKIGSVKHRLKLSVLIELIRYQLSIGLFLTESCQIVYGGDIDFYSTLFECDQLVVSTFQSLTTAERDLNNETMAFQAIEQLLGLVPGASLQFRRMVGSFDHEILNQPNGIKSVIDLLNDHKPSGQALLHPNPTENWDRFISIRLKDICHTMRYVLAATMRTLLTDTMRTILTILPRMLPCDMPTEFNQPCVVCQREHPSYLYLSDISYAQCIFSHLKQLAYIQRRITTLAAQMGAHRLELNELKLESFNISQSIITLMLPTCTAPHLWPIEQRLKLRDEPTFRILFDQYCQQLIGDEFGSHDHSSSGTAQSQPVTSSSSSIFPLRTLMECLLASMHTTTPILIPNDRISPIAPTKLFEADKEYMEKLSREKQEAYDSFVRKHGGWEKIQHDKQKKTKCLKLQREMQEYQPRMKQMFERERMAFTVGTVANGLAHALNYQSILQHATTLDLQMLADSPITSHRRHHQVTLEPSRNDRLLNSVLDGSRALLKYYRDLVLPMTQLPTTASSTSSSSSSTTDHHPLCQSNVGYISSPHTCCMSIFTFLHLCQHFITLLICYYHRFACTALPRSVIFECMGDSASSKLYEFALKSAPLQFKAAIQPIDSLLHAFRDILTDLILKPNRLNGFCSELVGERFCRGSSSFHHITTNWTRDGPTHAQIVTQTLHILISIGLNHTRAGWIYSLRAIYDMPSNIKESLLPMLSMPLQDLFTDLRSPQSFESSMRTFPPVDIDWSRKYTVHFSDGIKQFESSARQLIFAAMTKSDNPILVLAKSDVPKYFNVLTKFFMNGQTFSVSEITGITHPPLPPPPKRGKGATKSSVSLSSSSSSAAVSKDVDNAPVESTDELDAATTIGISVIGMDKSELNELMLEQSTTMAEAALKQSEELKQTALGILNTDRWKNRCHAWLNQVRAIRLMTPEQQLQRMHQRWVDQFGRDWKDEYKSAFIHRVPKLSQKVNQQLELAMEFRSKQLALKSKEEHETRNQPKPTSSSTSDSMDPVDDVDDLDHIDSTRASSSLVSSAAFLFQFRSNGDMDPYSLHRCHALIRTLEDCQRSLSIKQLSHQPDLARLEHDLQLVSTTIIDVEKMLAGKPIQQIATRVSPPHSSIAQQEAEEVKEVAEDECTVELGGPSTPIENKSPVALSDISPLPTSTNSCISNPPTTMSSAPVSASEPVTVTDIEQSQPASTPTHASTSTPTVASLIPSVASDSPVGLVASISPDVSQRRCVRCGSHLPSTLSSEVARCDPCREEIRLKKKQDKDKAKKQKEEQRKVAEEEKLLKERMEADEKERVENKINSASTTATATAETIQLASSSSTIDSTPVTHKPNSSFGQNDIKSATTVPTTPSGPGAFLLTLGLINEHTPSIVADGIRHAAAATVSKEMISCIDETLGEVKDQIDAMTLRIALIAVYLEKKDLVEAEKLIKTIILRLNSMNRSSRIEHLRVRFSFLVADWHYQGGALPRACEALVSLLEMKSPIGELARTKSNQYQHELRQRVSMMRLVMMRWKDDYSYQFTHENLEKWVDLGQVACHKCHQWFSMTTAQFVFESSAPFCSTCKKKWETTRVLPITNSKPNFGPASSSPPATLTTKSISSPPSISTSISVPTTASSITSSVTIPTNKTATSTTASPTPTRQTNSTPASTTSVSLVSHSTPTLKQTASSVKSPSTQSDVPKPPPMMSSFEPAVPSKMTPQNVHQTSPPFQPPSSMNQSGHNEKPTMRDVASKQIPRKQVNTKAAHESKHPAPSAAMATPLANTTVITSTNLKPATEEEWTTVASHKPVRQQPLSHVDVPLPHPPTTAHCFRDGLFKSSYDKMVTREDTISTTTAQHCVVANGHDLRDFVSFISSSPVDHEPNEVIDILIGGGWLLESERIHVQWTFTMRVTLVAICFDSIDLVQTILTRAAKRVTRPTELRLMDFKMKKTSGGQGSGQSPTVSTSTVSSPAPTQTTKPIHHHSSTTSSTASSSSTIARPTAVVSTTSNLAPFNRIRKKVSTSVSIPLSSSVTPTTSVTKQISPVKMVATPSPCSTEVGKPTKPPHVSPKHILGITAKPSPPSITATSTPPTQPTKPPIVSSRSVANPWFNHSSTTIYPTK